MRKLLTPILYVLLLGVSWQTVFGTELKTMTPPSNADQATVEIFLPLLSTPPAIVDPLTAVSSSCNDNDFNYLAMPENRLVLAEPPLRMAILASAMGYQGQSYHAIWVINGVEIESLSLEGVVPPDGAIGSPAFSPGASCADPHVPGTYTVNFYIEGQLILSPSVVLE